MDEKSRSAVASSLRTAASALVSAGGEVGDARASLAMARAASEHVTQALRSVDEALKRVPADKSLAAAKAALTKAALTFEKQEASAGKILRDAAKKGAPPALVKEAKKLEKLLKARLVDPSVLHVIPWTDEPFTKGVTVYRMVFRIPTDKLPEKLRSFYSKRQSYGNHLLMKMPSGTAEPPSWEKTGVLRMTDVSGYNEKDYDQRGFVDSFFDNLSGWEGLKGEGEANVGRAQVAEQVKSALNSGLRRMHAYDTREAEVDGLTVRVDYRSSLPKEGERAVGEDRYYQMVEKEIAEAKKVFEPLLAPFKDKIKAVRFRDEEKSWISIDVTLR